MSVWDSLVGQKPVIDMLSRIAQGDPSQITQSWLICGPPGSGRSNMARAFAAALESPDHGMSAEPTRVTQQVLAGTHPDVTVLTTNKVTIGIDQVREIITTSEQMPATAPWRIIIIEDVDRMLERTTNVLLKEIEEPAEHCIWLLCAPSAQDVLPTIRSRCRPVYMPRLPEETIRQELLSRGQTPERAAYAARLSEGVLGRAIALCGQDPYYRCRDEAVALLRALREKADIPKASLAWEERRKPEDSLPFLEAMEAVLRDIVRVQSGLAPFDAQIESELEEFARHFTIEGVACIMEEVVTVRKRVHAHVQWRSAAEPLLRRIVEGAEK